MNFAIVLIGLLVISGAFACTCLDRAFCIKTSEVEYLLRGNVTSSNTSDPDTTLYTIAVRTIFKGDINVTTFEVQTAASTATCGVPLEIGGDYLIGANADLSISLCGPTTLWASLSPADRKIAREGGDCQVCATVRCARFKKCKVGNNGRPFCADVCDPGRCKKNEVCTLSPATCAGDGPCPDVAKCVPSVPSISKVVKSTEDDCLKICTLDYRPVCGSNGKTYGNPCDLRNAQCQNPGLTLAHNGECCSKDCCPFQECRKAESGEEYCADICHPNRCKEGTECKLQTVQCVRAPCPPIATCVPSCKSRICPLIYAPVCGTDGITYGNGCELARAQCDNPLLREAHKGECKTKPVPCPNPICPQIYQPLCGSDGKTYSNKCYFANAQCRDKKLTLAYEGACPEEKKCRQGCPKIYSPVCSNQGVTYGNKCLLDLASCKDPGIWFKKEGECPKCA